VVLSIVEFYLFRSGFKIFMNLKQITDALLDDLQPLRFSLPVTHVYNPLIYAREAFDQYLNRYAHNPIEVVLLGMNPGPWGMAQTGIPFGEVKAVKIWMGIEAHVGKPSKMHTKRPVQGFTCKRSEVSGKRLWGWAHDRFGTPERFFSRFFVVNYCPLLFIEASGRNRTPNKLRAAERQPLLSVCDRALRQTIRWFKPRYVVGVGEFATERARTALDGLNVNIGRITHPSPANPKANRGWDTLISQELLASGLQI
jgi:single-strand selective monofunctional uracil DNA glycosylase